MSGQPKPNPLVDPYGYLNLTLNPDGSITRGDPLFPSTSPTHDPNSSPELVLSKDIPINPSNQTWARVFIPRELGPTNKLPLIVYYHGGGFILLSAASNICHDFCLHMAAELSAVVVSIEYRLAPEHRLPAAYDDAVEALKWLNTTTEEWVTNYADYSNCFLMGSSAGGNIAYHACLREAAEVDDLQPLKIRGLILHHPFFGGVRRRGSEVRLVNDPVLPPVVSDVMWELSLPLGVDRDHEYCNPTAGGGSKALEKMGVLGWKVLIGGCHGDPLVDRQMELGELMKGKGIDVVGYFVVGGYHGLEMGDPSKAKAFYLVIRDFLLSSVVN